MKTETSYWIGAGLAIICAGLALVWYGASTKATDTTAVDAVDPEFTTRTIKPKRPRGGAEQIVVLVEVGPLPFGSVVAVADNSGKILGSVAPHSLQTNLQSYKAAIPLPRREQGDKDITLRFWVVEQGDKKKRAPTQEELLSVELAYDAVRQD